MVNSELDVGDRFTASYAPRTSGPLVDETPPPIGMRAWFISDPAPRLAFGCVLDCEPGCKHLCTRVISGQDDAIG